MRTLGFWLRWSWRDLRERWLLVAAIALTIGIGTGAYGGLTSTSEWRNQANDASYASLRMFDIRVRISDGSTLPAGRIESALQRIKHPEWIHESQARLVLPIQVDASTDASTILVPGQIIGVDVAQGSALIAGMAARSGRILGPGDANRDVAVLDFHFGREKNLPESGLITVSGGHDLRYVGQILTPEYFIVSTAAGGLLGEANFAAVMAPLGTVQRITGHPGEVNDVVVRLAPGVDADKARAEIETVLARDLPTTAVTVDRAVDDAARKVLYGEIATDQKFYYIFALVILGGATLAAFNLTSRIVEAQRRQIGVSMALGVPRRWIAFRPMLVGAQVALSGVVLGIVVGYVLDLGMDGLLQRYFPLPVWSAPFQPLIFAQAAILGFILPFAACIYPVLRAVNVPPIAAIRTGFLSARNSGWAPLARRVRLPGGVLTQMPLRNILRTPRRTLLTSLGIAAAVTVFVGTSGLTDTFLRTIEIGQAETLKTSPDRLRVGLDDFASSTVALARMHETGVVSAAEAEIVVGATAHANGRTQGLFIEFVNLHSPLWVPTLLEGTMPKQAQAGHPPGILLAQAAAAELGVAVGDLIEVSHPRRRGAVFEDVKTEMVVAGLTPVPLKSASSMTIDDAGIVGLRGFANRLTVIPSAGTTVSKAQRNLFDAPGVVSVESISATAQVFKHLVDQYLSILVIVQYTALAMALLIAFNSATIALDERSRENATMLAFGARFRAVIGMAVLESAIIGLIGTLIGLVGGRILVELIVRLVVRDVVPDIGVTVTLNAGTIVLATVLGVVAVGSAPLLGVRRLRRLNIPDALRVVE